MADFFRSALGYIGNVGGVSENDFVGQNVELGQQKLRVKRLIAEGSDQWVESPLVPLTVCVFSETWIV